jgi:hypothetical protein
MKPVLALSLLFALAATVVAQPAGSEFYPLKVGQQWTYQVFDLKSAQPMKNPSGTVVVEVEREEPFVRMKPMAGKNVEERFAGFILKSTSGGKTTRDHVAILEEGIHRIHAAGTQMTPPLLFLRTADPGGKPWEANSTSGNTTIKGTFTPRLEDIKLSDGKQGKVLIVSFRGDQAGEARIEIDCWYLPGVGLAQQRIKTKNHEILLKLTANAK